MVRYILTLPLNAIPAIGSIVFLYLNGENAGPGYHARYFDLKGYTKEQRTQHIAKHQAEYTASVLDHKISHDSFADIFGRFVRTVSGWSASVWG